MNTNKINIKFFSQIIEISFINFVEDILYDYIKQYSKLFYIKFNIFCLVVFLILTNILLFPFFLFGCNFNEIVFCAFKRNQVILWLYKAYKIGVGGLAKSSDIYWRNMTHNG